MPEDASLDQFASPEPTDSEDSEDDPENSEVDVEDGVADSGESATAAGDGVADPDEVVKDPETDDDSESTEEVVEPAVSTYQWSPEGRECADCGTSADRLWRADGQKSGDLVCPDCKDW